MTTAFRFGFDNKVKPTVLTIRRGHELIYCHSESVALRYLADTKGLAQGGGPLSPEPLNTAGLPLKDTSGGHDFAQSGLIFASSAAVRDLIAGQMGKPCKDGRNVYQHLRAIGAPSKVIRTVRSLFATSDGLRHSCRSSIDF